MTEQTNAECKSAEYLEKLANVMQTYTLGVNYGDRAKAIRSIAAELRTLHAEVEDTRIHRDEARAQRDALRTQLTAADALLAAAKVGNWTGEWATLRTAIATYEKARNDG
jgi:hypothetical protein